MSIMRPAVMQYCTSADRFVVEISCWYGSCLSADRLKDANQHGIQIFQIFSHILQIDFLTSKHCHNDPAEWRFRYCTLKIFE